MTGKRTLCVSLILSQAGRASEDDTKAVTRAAAQFYAALNTMFTGDADPMKEGFRVGWGQVRQSWEAQAALTLGGRVEATDMRVTVGRDIALTHNYESGENRSFTASRPPEGGLRFR